MFCLISLMLLTLSKHVIGDGCDGITTSLMEEVMSLKDQIATLQLQLELDIQELQLSSTSCDGDSSTGSASLVFIIQII